MLGSQKLAVGRRDISKAVGLAVLTYPADKVYRMSAQPFLVSETMTEEESLQSGSDGAAADVPSAAPSGNADVTPVKPASSLSPSRGGCISGPGGGLSWSPWSRPLSVGLRAAFVPSPGCVLLSVDYSQVPHSRVFNVNPPHQGLD